MIKIKLKGIYQKEISLLDNGVLVNYSISDIYLFGIKIGVIEKLIRN